MSWIETYQNIANLVVSTVTSATMYSYYFVSPDYLDFAIPLLFVHLTSDLFLTKKPDIIFHHIVSLTFISYNYIMDVSHDDSNTIILTLYSTELSTFFYVAKLFLQNVSNKGGLIRTATTINDILFFVTFFKFRVYDFYVYIIARPDTYIGLDKYNGHLLLYASLHTLNILNLYWFSIICKIVAKPLMKSLSNPHWICHKVLSYTFVLDMFVAMYSLKYGMIEMTGLFVFSLTSHAYHDTMTRVNSYLSDETTWYYIQYITAIHLRSFLAVCTSDIIHPFFVGLSLWIHQICYVLSLLHYKYAKNTIHLDDKTLTNKSTEIQYILTGFPMALDILLLSISGGPIYSIGHFYTFICMIIIAGVNPFYDLSRIAFHICLIANTYVK